MGDSKREHRYECRTCGFLAPGTIGGQCNDCREEDRHVASLYEAAQAMETMVAVRRHQIRRRVAEEQGYRRWLETPANS